MAAIMMTAMPLAGHARPVIAVAAELVRRGHEVRAYTGAAYIEAFEAVGAHGVPWRAAPDFDERDYTATFPRLRNRKGFGQLIINLKDMFVETAPAQAQDLLAAHADRPWDVIAGDSMTLGTRFAAERIGSRWASLHPAPPMISADGPPSGLGLAPGTTAVGRARDAVLRRAIAAGTAPLTRFYQRTRARAGLAPDRGTFTDMWFSPERIIASGSSALDYGRTDQPSRIRFVGDLTDDGSTAPAQGLPPWWADVVDAEVPVVHVTQGTANVDPGDLIVPALEALADRDVLVVVGLGPRTPPLPGPLPANARVAPMVPHHRLLPLTSVMLTNGGFGGVLTALRHGVPLIVAGGDLDKPEVAARVGWAGAGIDLRTGTPRPAAVRTAYDRVVSDPGFRQAAARIGDEIRELGGTRAAADLVEDMLR